MGMICDCEPFEVCPSCAPPWRGDGTVVVETGPACQHNHGVVTGGEVACFDCRQVITPSVEVPRTYTLEKIDALADEFTKVRHYWTEEDRTNTELVMSAFMLWLAKREKELRG